MHKCVLFMQRSGLGLGLEGCEASAGHMMLQSKEYLEEQVGTACRQAAGKAGRWFLNYAPFAVNNKFNPWYKQRDMPNGPKESFSEWYAKNEGNKN